jgi:hypothetical protein
VHASSFLLPPTQKRQAVSSPASQSALVWQGSPVLAGPVQVFVTRLQVPVPGSVGHACRLFFAPMQRFPVYCGTSQQFGSQSVP